MKKILIPTDFSSAATTALHYGIEMAKATNAEVHLLHVYQIPVSFAETPVVMMSVDELKESAEKQMENLKNEVMHIAPSSVRVITVTRLGSIVDEIENYCREINPFTVVMGSTGKTGLEKALFGSNTLTAIRHLTWPVICVPPGTNYGKGIRKIGFACDYKNVADATPAETIKSFQKEFDASLHVLNVQHEDADNKVSSPDEIAGLYQLFEDAHPVYHFIESENVEEGIHAFAEENNLDLIIAIPKKHKLLESIFKNSATRQLIYHSHVPIMCVHE